MKWRQAVEDFGPGARPASACALFLLLALCILAGARAGAEDPPLAWILGVEGDGPDLVVLWAPAAGATIPDDARLVARNGADVWVSESEPVVASPLLPGLAPPLSLAPSAPLGKPPVPVTKTLGQAAALGYGQMEPDSLAEATLPETLEDSRVKALGRQQYVALEDGEGELLSDPFPYHLLPLALLPKANSNQGCGYKPLGGLDAPAFYLTSRPLQRFLDHQLPPYDDLKDELDRIAPYPRHLECEIEDLRDWLSKGYASCAGTCAFFWETVVDEDPFSEDGWTAPPGAAPGWEEWLSQQAAASQCVDVQVVGPQPDSPFTKTLLSSADVAMGMRRRCGSDGACPCAATTQLTATHNSEVYALAELDPEGGGAWVQAWAEASQDADLLLLQEFEEDLVPPRLILATSVIASAETTELDSPAEEGTASLTRSATNVGIGLPAAVKLEVDGSASARAVGESWAYASFRNLYYSMLFAAEASTYCADPRRATLELRSPDLTRRLTKLTRYPD